MAMSRRTVSAIFNGTGSVFCVIGLVLIAALLTGWRPASTDITGLWAAAIALQSVGWAAMCSSAWMKIGVLESEKCALQQQLDARQSDG